MAEYNVKYLELKRRLRILKLLNNTDLSLTFQQRSDKGKILDVLLKELDNRYAENLFLDEIEMSVENLER